MNKESKKEALNNALRSFNLPEKYNIVTADARLGHKFAIASKTEHGGINTHSAYMTYEEMNSYLIGYNTAIKTPLSN